ncbi:MAG: 4'-phosphopantetheinyl transferase superfamily protein [Bdellovibrionota bacterium]
MKNIDQQLTRIIGDKWKEFVAGGLTAVSVRAITNNVEARACREEVTLQLRRSVKNEPAEIFLSLSHTIRRLTGGVRDGLAVAIGYAASSAAVKAIGVDMEYQSRNVHPSILNRIAGAHERHAGLKVLEYWVAKEACFKATPMNHGLLLSDYSVLGFDADKGVGQMSVEKNHAQLEFMLIYVSGLIVGLAINNGIQR